MDHRLERKDTLPAMRAAGFLLGLVGVRFGWFWTTYRWPFGRPIIAYPEHVADPTDERHGWIIEHELAHVRQQRGIGLLWSALLYFVFPLPFYLSGRWFIERGPYLGDILSGHRSITKAVDMLHSSYLRPWPRSWMRRWFEAEVRKAKSF